MKQGVKAALEKCAKLWWNFQNSKKLAGEEENNHDEDEGDTNIDTGETDVEDIITTIEDPDNQPEEMEMKKSKKGWGKF